MPAAGRIPSQAGAERIARRGCIRRQPVIADEKPWLAQLASVASGLLICFDRTCSPLPNRSPTLETAPRRKRCSYLPTGGLADVAR